MADSLIPENPFFTLGMEIIPGLDDLNLKKVFITGFRHPSECGIPYNVFLYCLEVNAKVFEVKIFISLPNIRILFYILEIQLMLMCEIYINFRWT